MLRVPFRLFSILSVICGNLAGIGARKWRAAARETPGGVMVETRLG
jgi:hypothetical protein